MCGEKDCRVLVKNCLYCASNQLEVVTHRVDERNILKCVECKLLMTEYVDEDPKSLYTSDYFEKSEETGTGYTGYLSAPAANVIGKYSFARLFGASKGSHLDLGCADGSLMELFKADGFNTRGLDISSDMIEVIKRKGIEARQSDLTSIPADYLGNQYITAFDVFEHSSSPGVAIQKAKAALSKNGYLIFSTLSVREINPAEYWFNHSLEHYTYYTKESLDRILSDIFGKGNFEFVQIEINGVAEFWGVASGSKLGTGVKKLIKSIATNKIDEPATLSYYLSLFLNQVARFDESRAVINRHRKDWSADELICAEFYNYFFQGKLELAINKISKDVHRVPLSSAAFWQAYASAQSQLSDIEKQTILKESADQILELRGELFNVRDQLHALQNSRVVGRIIKARDAIGDAVPKVRRFPKKAAVAVKVRVARHLPEEIRKPVMRAIRYRPRRRVSTNLVANRTLSSDQPLVSVVVPYYNRADVIDDTLESLRLQTFGNFEIIIVNDGSPEKGSQEKFEQLQKDGYPAIFINQSNQGVAAARNNGIARARGKYIVCLDSDDLLDPTYIEKAVTVLETQPDVSIVSTYMRVFGVVEDTFEHAAFSPLGIYRNNMIITAAMFKKEAWEVSGGYKPGIGYEDWEYWINLVKHGFWAAQIPEHLFIYRTSMQSRYVEDKDIHWNNLKAIRSLHSDFKTKVNQLLKKRMLEKSEIESSSAFVNLFTKPVPQEVRKSNVLITVPWMTFGGAETLIYNFCREIKDDYNITFVTGLKSDNEWEYKFKEISSTIFHLPNILPSEDLYLGYVEGLIRERSIDTLHIIHNGFTFPMLSKLKERYPSLRVILTLFNDRAAYFDQSLEVSKHIDIFTSDNSSVINHYSKTLPEPSDVRVIPNGINCVTEFNPALHDRWATRAKLDIEKDELAVFFIGRLSEEKNPDVFLDSANSLLSDTALTEKLKFFVIGDGVMRGQVERRIKEIDSDRVTYLGYRSDIAQLLSAADVFVLPSSIEGFPLSILEAMAMNVVPVASNVGAVSEVIASGEDGFVIKPGSADEISKVLKDLLVNEKLLNAMKRRARAKVESKYSNPVLGRNYRKLYGGKS